MGRGLSLGISIPSSLETADDALKEVVGQGGTKEARPQLLPADPEWAAPTPAALSLGHKACC